MIYINIIIKNMFTPLKLIFIFTFLFGMMDEKILIPSNNKAGDTFSSSIAISNNTMIVGAPHASYNTYTQSGAAYIYILNTNNEWQEHSVLYPNEISSYAHFGFDVAIDNNVAIVSAIGDNENGPFAGAVYVFRYNGNSWNQEAKLISSTTGPSDHFGHSLDIKNNLVVIGAYQAGRTGRAYIFRYTTPFWSQNTYPIWIQETTLLGNDINDNDYFGYSVSLSNDETVFISAHLHDSNGFNSGAVYVFNKNGSWVQTTKLTANNSQRNDLFGYSISAYSNLVLIGSYNSSGLEKNSGSAYIYTKNNSIWSQTNILTASDGKTNDQFGISVSLNGNKALIGASRTELANKQDVGSAYFFVKNTQNIWEEIEIIKPQNASPHEYYGLSLDMNHKELAIGSRLNDTIGNNSGSLITYSTLYSTPEHFNYSSELFQQNGNTIISDVLQLNNYGDENLIWSLSYLSNWISIQENTGDLLTNSSKNINISISLDGLTNNIYNDTLLITFIDKNYDIKIPISLNLSTLDIYTNNMLPKTYSIKQIYPNPFNPITTIRFGLPKNSNTSIIVYDLQGRKVINLIDKYLLEGYHNIVWNASNYSTGIYLIQMKGTDFIHNQKIMLVK